MTVDWKGVLPALTTPFDGDLEIDHDQLALQCEQMLAAGCNGVIPAGSVGEGTTLSADEKAAVFETCVGAVQGRGAVVAGIAALSTAEAVELARRAEASGCDGLMVLPPYAYSTDPHEMGAHVSAIIEATALPCMLYNNPLSYVTDFVPSTVAGLAEAHGNLVAVKESSGDVRRITELRRLLGDRVDVLVGVDDLVVEGVTAGATGWVAGLVNALPAESVALFRLAADARTEEARRLYDWFLPLLRFDTVPKLVQLIKLVQEVVGGHPGRVRPPRLPLSESERSASELTIRFALEQRPVLETPA
jgi:4-hydroxy-tetrahydrodipicolinate synthase